MCGENLLNVCQPNSIAKQITDNCLNSVIMLQLQNKNDVFNVVIRKAKGTNSILSNSNVKWNSFRFFFAVVYLQLLINFSFGQYYVQIRNGGNCYGGYGCSVGYGQSNLVALTCDQSDWTYTVFTYYSQTSVLSCYFGVGSKYCIDFGNGNPYLRGGPCDGTDLYQYIKFSGSGTGLSSWQAKQTGSECAEPSGNSVTLVNPSSSASCYLWQIVTFCSSGYFSTPSALGCSVCPTGTYNPSNAFLTSCIACPPGTYNANLGSTIASACASCTAGKFSLPGSSKCSVCPAGSTSSAGSSSCSISGVTWPVVGQNFQIRNQGSCYGGNGCGRGLVGGKLGPISCDPSYYGDSVYSLAGNVIYQFGSLSCSSGYCIDFASNIPYMQNGPCDGSDTNQYFSFSNNKNGQWTWLSSATGSKCAVPNGTSISVASASICSLWQIVTYCSAGQYSFIYTLLSCQSCSPGTYNPSAGFVTACTFCPAGTYSQSAGSTGCSVCPAGTHSSNLGATSLSSCVSCPAGTFSPAGSAFCSICPAGSTSSQGSGSCSIVGFNWPIPGEHFQIQSSGSCYGANGCGSAVRGRQLSPKDCGPSLFDETVFAWGGSSIYQFGSLTCSSEYCVDFGSGILHLSNGSCTASDGFTGLSFTHNTNGLWSWNSNSFVCGSTFEDHTMSLDCGVGQVMSSVQFAGYGTPIGSCGSFQAGSCNLNVSNYIRTHCIGAQSCSIFVDNDNFGSDPCSGIGKYLYVQVTCSSASYCAVPNPAGSNIAVVSSSSISTCSLWEIVSFCAAGQYSSGAALGTCISCPTGTYIATPGFFPSCIVCSAGSFAPSIGSTSAADCRDCLAGYFCPGDGTERPCGIDQSTDGYTGFNRCRPCNTAAGYSTIGLLGQASCVHIPEGYYYVNGTRLQYCGTNNRTQHWIGGGYDKTTCRCDTGYTGDHCEFPVCESLLSFQASLGTLLMNSDSTLIQASKGFLTASPLAQANTEAYLNHLLSVDIDINGDGQISNEEMLRYLQSRSIYSVGMQNLSVWCSPAIAPSPSKCHRYLYPVNSIFTESIHNFLTSSKHKFDGSGVAFITNLTSTFPSPSWNDEMCRAYDSTYGPDYKHVRTTWNFTHLYGYQIQKVCGYVNGVLNNDFSTTRLLAGEQTDFVDFNSISPTNQFKRVYCVLVYFLWKGASTQAFECAVGLFYVSSSICRSKW